MLVLVLHASAPHLVEALDSQVLTRDLSQDGLLFLGSICSATGSSGDLVVLLFVLAFKGEPSLLNFCLLLSNFLGLLLGRVFF